MVTFAEQSFLEVNPLNVQIVLKLIKLLKQSGQYEGIRKLLVDTQERAHTASFQRDGTDFGCFTAGMHYARGYVAWHLDNDGDVHFRTPSFLTVKSTFSIFIYSYCSGR